MLISRKDGYDEGVTRERLGSKVFIHQKERKCKGEHSSRSNQNSFGPQIFSSLS